MKKILFTIACVLCALIASAQGRNISRAKKIEATYITDDGDSIRIGTTLKFGDNKGSNNQYKYVQLLNKFEEPIQPATTRITGQKQPVKYFKMQDEVVYAFTEYCCINIEAALGNGEVILPKPKAAPKPATPQDTTKTTR